MALMACPGAPGVQKMRTTLCIAMKTTQNRRQSTTITRWCTAVCVRLCHLRNSRPRLRAANVRASVALMIGRQLPSAALLGAVLCTIAGTAPALAADQTPKSLKDLQECREISADAARLACYDKAVGAFAASVTAKDVVVVDRAEVQQRKKKSFGLPFTEGGILGPSAGPETSQVTARITAVRPWGQFLQITLDNGAVWQTTESSFLDPVAGSDVTIKRSILGNFKMIFPKGAALSAKRVR